MLRYWPKRLQNPARACTIWRAMGIAQRRQGEVMEAIFENDSSELLLQF
jgi:hypothetical protein